MGRARGRRLLETPVNTLGLALLLTCLGSAAAAFDKWSLELPWAEPPENQRAPSAVFGDVLVMVAGLGQEGWVLAGLGAAGAATGQVLWRTKLPLGSGIPSPVALAGELAVLELDGRVLAVHPGNGSVAWSATSPCSLGKPRMVNARAAHLAAYLICDELSGDSTIAALHAANGSIAWTISSYGVAGAAVRVRAATAAPGLFIYSDTGSSIIALSVVDSSVQWRVKVGALPDIDVGASVTHLEMAGARDELLLVREYTAASNFSHGPSSYLAYQLGEPPGANGALAGRPRLLWSAEGRPALRDLPPGTSAAAPFFVGPAVSPAEDLFFYWTAVQKPAPPAPPLLPAAASPAPAPVVPAAPQDGATARGAPIVLKSVSSTPQRRQLLEAAAAASGPAPASEPPLAASVDGTAAGVDPAAAPAANATVVTELQTPHAVAAETVKPQTEGVGVLPPEGLISVPVLKARRISSGEEVWRVEMQPVSPPTAAASSVAVITPDGLQVLSTSTGALDWEVRQQPLGIYPYTPTLVPGGTVAVHNCMDLIASNSLCLYRESDGPAGQHRQVEAAHPAAAPGDAEQTAPAAGSNREEGEAPGDSTTSGAAAAAQASLPLLVMLLCIAMPILF